MMDILHLSREEIKKIPLGELGLALDYCWNTHLQRRVDYWIAKAFSDGKKPIQGNKGSERSIDWTPLNPVAQKLAREKNVKRRPIPESFIKYMESEQQ